MLANFMPNVRLAVIIGGLVAILAAGTVGWFLGSANQKTECEREKTKEYAALLEDQHKQLAQYNTELEERVAVADKASREAANLSARLRTLTSGITHEIEKRNPSIACGPTDREHSLYLEAARSTRNPEG